MSSFRTRKMILAICLMASLFVGQAPAACSCSHHGHPTTGEEGECHSHHMSAETAEGANDGDVCDSGCICVVEQTLPAVASRSPGKEFKSDQSVGEIEHVAENVEFVTASGYREPASRPPPTSRHSTTLKSLLPSRAPPRL